MLSQAASLQQTKTSTSVIRVDKSSRCVGHASIDPPPGDLNPLDPVRSSCVDRNHPQAAVRIIRLFMDNTWVDLGPVWTSAECVCVCVWVNTVELVQRKKVVALFKSFDSVANPVWKWDSSHLFSFHRWIFIWRSVGVHLRGASFRRTGGRGCCCNPQAAEQNPSGDFTPPSPSSSLPHLLVPSSPLFPFLLRLHWWASLMGWSLLGAELITTMSKQVERWAGCSAINSSAALDWCGGSECMPIHKLAQTSEVTQVNLNKTWRNWGQWSRAGYWRYSQLPLTERSLKIAAFHVNCWVVVYQGAWP